MDIVDGKESHKILESQLHMDIRTILCHARTLMLSTVAVNTDKILSIKISIDT